MNPTQWRLELLSEFYWLMHAGVADNYDAYRFSSDGIDRSCTINLAQHASYLTWFIEHTPELFATWLLLQDDESRQLFRRLILFRLLGHLHVAIRPGVGYAALQALLEQARTWEVGPAELALGGMFGELKRYQGQVRGRTLTLDAWAGSVAGSFLAEPRQYYFERAGVRIAPELGNWVIDGGACLGDTAVAFALSVGDSGRVLAFDPLPQHQQASRHNARLNGLAETIAVLPYALGAKTNVAFTSAPPHAQETGVQAGGAIAPGFSILGREASLPVVALDDYFAQHPLARLDFVKLDIEGAELAALQGMAQSIRAHRPKLAISLYHRVPDFVEIPQFIAAVFPFYDLYLDHYTIHAEETVLYGLPR